MIFLLRYWRWIAVGVLIIAAIGAILSFGHRQYERGVADAKVELQKELERERELHRQVDWKVRQDYEARIADLNAKSARELRGRPIRCVLGDASEVRQGRDPSGSTDGSTGESAVLTAPDLRSRIVRAGETCEGLRQQLIAIKQRQEALREK